MALVAGMFAVGAARTVAVPVLTDTTCSTAGSKVMVTSYEPTVLVPVFTNSGTLNSVPSNRGPRGSSTPMTPTPSARAAGGVLMPRWTVLEVRAPRFARTLPVVSDVKAHWGTVNSARYTPGSTYKPANGMLLAPSRMLNWALWPAPRGAPSSSVAWMYARTTASSEKTSGRVRTRRRSSGTPLTTAKFRPRLEVVLA